jgi:hypothetical protein
MAGRTVTIELGGKTRHLKYDLNAIAEISDRLHITVKLNNFAQDLMSTPLSFSALRVLLWAGLRHEDSELTIEQVGSWVDLDNMGEVWERFFMLFGDKFSAKVEAVIEQISTPDRPNPTSTPDSQDLSESPTAPSESAPVSSGI